MLQVIPKSRPKIWSFRLERGEGDQKLVRYPAYLPLKLLALSKFVNEREESVGLEDRRQFLPSRIRSEIPR